MPKIITQEVFRDSVLKDNPNLTILGVYVDSGAKVDVRCEICHGEWETTPKYLKKTKAACPYCSGRSGRSRLGKTTEEFQKELDAAGVNVELLEPYKGSNRKIRVRCKDCGFEWSGRAVDMLRGHGCRRCANKRLSKAFTLSPDIFEAKFAALHAPVKLIGKYTGNKNRIEVECSLCGRRWMALPGSLMSGQKCPACSNSRKRKTTEGFKKELSEISRTITLLSPYTSSRDKVKLQCQECGHIWYALPNNLLKGSGCPKCAARLRGEKRKKLAG